MLQKLFAVLVCTVSPVFLGILGIRLGLREQPHDLLFILGGALFIAVGLGFFLSITGVLPERRQRALTGQTDQPCGVIT